MILAPIWLGSLTGIGGCGSGDDDVAGAPPPGSPSPTAVVGARCGDHNPLRNAYFGDLHVHTAFSWDAYAWGTRVTPDEAYDIARGGEISISPLDPAGAPTRPVRLRRPLDFAAVTDHAEFFGETAICATPGVPGFDSDSCDRFRGSAGQQFLGVPLVLPDPRRRADICGDDDARCQVSATDIWQETIAAAERANTPCELTTFVAYEYSSSLGISTRHRNVIFRNATVPDPVTHFDAPTAPELWALLRQSCHDAGTGCDALAIPHNTNQSNGQVFAVEYPEAETLAEQRSQAAARAAIEPLIEIYQHRGDSECRNGLRGIIGAPDEYCAFEKIRQAPFEVPFEDCDGVPGSGGAAGGGCISILDSARGALLTGLAEAERIGVNPYPLGIIASTDGHFGAAGAVDEDRYLGTASQVSGPTVFGDRLRDLRSSPGGLAGVWAEENTREAIFLALRRRETFGTSGPRIRVRLFAAWDLPDDICEMEGMYAVADAAGVPMGGTLPARESPSAAPALLLSALRDPVENPGVAAPLQRIQVVKGWVEDGELHQFVYDVAGDPDNGARVDLETCALVGDGFASLCARWVDPDFDPARHAFYYARVLQNPTCRWNRFECLRNTPPLPAFCNDEELPEVVQERAWSSPVWYAPED